MPSLDQEPRIWHPFTFGILGDTQKYYIRLFSSPYKPLFVTFYESTLSFEDIYSLEIYPYYDVEQWSEYYTFP